MFVANQSFENHFLSALGSAGDRYYRAMELTGRLTWYIVTCVLQDDGIEMLHSVCCSLDEDLLALLEPTPNSRAVCLQRVVASGREDGRWDAREVSKVWRASALRGKQVLVFQDGDGSEWSGPFGGFAEPQICERTLVYEAAPSAKRSHHE